MLTVTVKVEDQPARFYRLWVTPAWAQRHDNGALVSIGLTVPKDLSRGAFQRALSKFKYVQLTEEEWNHSGCQSSCVKRGGKECRW